MNELILIMMQKAIAEQVAEDAWEDYQYMLDRGELEPTDDPKTIFKRGIFSAIAGFVAAMECERQVAEHASKN